MIEKSKLLYYISLLYGLWNVLIDTEIKISITYLVEQLTRLGGTSSCGSQSSWCCLQPKRCKSQERVYHSLPVHPILHRQPVSPQTGGRGCVLPLVAVEEGRSRSRREGEGIFHWLRSRCGHYHQLRPPPLALMQICNLGNPSFDETDSKFWFQNTCEKSKIWLLEQ